MITVTRALVPVALLLLVAGPSPSWAGPPTDQLKAQIDRAVKILDDPALKNEGKQRERRRRQ